MGEEHIEVWRRPEDAAGTTVASGFGAIVRTDRVAAVLGECLALGATVVAAIRERELVGYANVVPSSALTRERWHALARVHELGALEVAQPARRRRVATALVDELPRAMPADDAILFARALAAHWDLRASGLDTFEYRRLLGDLLARAGFAREETDDPEVADHPMSFLAVRYGRRVDVASLSAFQGALRSGSVHG